MPQYFDLSLKLAASRRQNWSKALHHGPVNARQRSRMVMWKDRAAMVLGLSLSMGRTGLTPISVLMQTSGAVSTNAVVFSWRGGIH